jgi:hypothetical protein
MTHFKYLNKLPYQKILKHFIINFKDEILLLYENKLLNNLVFFKLLIQNIP